MNKKMNQKKQNRMAVRQAAAKAVLRDEQNRRIQFAATNPEGEVLKNLRTTLRGLDEDAVTASRAKYGSNKVTHEKKEIAGAASGGSLRQPLYRHSVLSGAGVHHDRYGVSVFFPVGQCAGGF